MSQIDCHCATVTSSPNHWWASSCANVSSPGARSNTGRVAVSSAYPTLGASSTIAPAESNGYGPYFDSKNRMIAGSFFTTGADAAASRGSSAMT